MIVPASVRRWPLHWLPPLLTQGPSDQRAISRPGLGWCRSSTRAGGRTGSAVSASKAMAICAACSWPARSPSSAMPRSMVQAPALAHGIIGTEADQGRRHRARQQHRTDGLGHDGARRALQGVEVVAGGVAVSSRQKVIRNWRGHNDVMQTRSFRGSGKPARVNASSNAWFGLGPDPRRALGPAAIRAASTGRTHDRTRPMLHQRKKALVNQAPSTHNPTRTSTALANG